MYIERKKERERERESGGSARRGTQREKGMEAARDRRGREKGKKGKAE